MSVDRQYTDLIRLVRDTGYKVNPRNGERVRLHAPDKIRFTSTPLVSVRKTAWKSAIREMEWFLSGSNKVADLHPSVRKWWEPWSNRQGRVNYNYSTQFRHYATQYDPDKECFVGFNQVGVFINGIVNKPYSARHVMTTWNTEEMYSDDCLITNCHGTVIQAFVNDGVLDLTMYQRSADLVCGVPHNWVQYWAFLLWLAHRTGNKPGTFIWDGGDVHLYAAHLPMADKITMADEEWSVFAITTPQLVYTPTSEEFLADDFSLDRPYTPLITESVEMVV